MAYKDKEKEQARKKERYQKRKEMGICVSCGKNETIDGKARCEACLEHIAKTRDREKMKADHKESLKFYKEHNLCPHCGKNRPLKNHALCYECIYKDTMRYIGMEYTEEQRQKNNERTKAYRDRMKENNRCYVCGKELSGTDYKSCPQCRYKKRVYEKQRRQDNGKIGYNQMGLCYICGNPVAEGKKVCEEHRKEMSERAYKASLARNRDENGRLKNSGTDALIPFGRNYKEQVQDRMNLL